MMFSLIDAGRLLLACAAGVPILLLPGLALAAIFRVASGRSTNTDTVFAPSGSTGLVFGLALLPLIASLAIRWVGVDGALVVSLALAAIGLLPPGRPPLRIGAIPLALTVAWLIISIVEWIDIDTGTQLFQPFTVIDAVKHAATAQAILDTGAPPRDPFFLRPERVGYYYFFYSLPALMQRLCCGAIDARAAMGGCVVWVGIGLFGLIRMVLAASGFAGVGRRPLLLAGVLAAGGLDILPTVRIGLLQGTWLPDPIAWNEQVGGWTESLLWVPHHITGLIAAMLGLVALSGVLEPGDEPAMRRQVAGVGLAGLCFASGFGVSVWVTLGLVGTVALWGVVLACERRWRAVTLLAAAGAIALVVSIPQLHDVLTDRVPGGEAPIALAVRAFAPVENLGLSGAWLMLARFVMLPLNYFAGFGALVSGAILYWGDRRAVVSEGRDMRRVLVIGALAGLLLGSLLKSTLFNNDLGWRVPLFPLLAGTIWTLVVLDRLPTATPVWRRVPGFLFGLLLLGWATTLYGLVALRAYPLFALAADYRFMAAHPATERALRVAYSWADRALPRGAVLQQDPTRPRVFAFALYGRHPTGVADSYGSLYGADPRAVTARITALIPIFRSDLPDAAIRAIATSIGIDDVVVTDADPVWSMPRSFVWRWAPVYASDHVRILPIVSTVKTAPAGDR
jgi:hypothetical protein